VVAQLVHSTLLGNWSDVAVQQPARHLGDLASRSQGPWDDAAAESCSEEQVFARMATVSGAVEVWLDLLGRRGQSESG